MDGKILFSIHIDLVYCFRLGVSDRDSCVRIGSGNFFLPKIGRKNFVVVWNVFVTERLDVDTLTVLYIHSLLIVLRREAASHHQQQTGGRCSVSVQSLIQSVTQSVGRSIGFVFVYYHGTRINHGSTDLNRERERREAI